MFLSFCLVVALLSATGMAKQPDATIDTSKEIINFSPLVETEKTVAIGTSIEELELPEMLSAMVRTAMFFEEEVEQDKDADVDVPAGEESVLVDEEVTQAGEYATSTEEEASPSGDDSATQNCEIPVTWTSEPIYNGDMVGIYVFTPVIDGYTLAEEAKLPTITVNTFG